MADQSTTGTLTADEVRGMRFGRPPFGARGYEMTEVDAFLERAAQALSGAVPSIGPEDVRAVVFHKPRVGRRGYDEQQVDDLLDRVEQALVRRGSGQLGERGADQIRPLQSAAETEAASSSASADGSASAAASASAATSAPGPEPAWAFASPPTYAPAVDAIDPDAMFDLARAGRGDELGRHLDAGMSADLADTKGDTLVMLAAYNGHPATVRALTARRADVNRLNNRNQSPLAGAVFRGDTEVVDALLEAGADPRAGSPSAVETARFFGSDDLTRRFEQR